MPVAIHDSFSREIPEFIIDSIVYCDALTFKRNEKSCFVLAKNLKFHEFRNKQLLHSLDLNATCLTTLAKQIQTYDGPRCKLTTEVSAGNAMQTVETTASDLALQKYIYRHFEINKLYLLLHCWDKLLVIEHSVTQGMDLIAEYENVVNFQIVPNMLMKYQAELKIHLNDASFICTDFQERAQKQSTTVGSSDNDSDCGNLMQKTEFKHLFERIRTAKAELQLHKEITQKQFQNVFNEQNFGNNFLRSTKLVEKFMLSKCGDLWFRITATDELVLGIPLVNNCAPPNLTILKNLQPVLNIEQAPALQFEHRLYQLCQTFENLETLETVFQTQDINFNDTMAWQRAAKEFQLKPNSFVVILLKLKLSQLILIERPCQLFIRYEVEKDLEAIEMRTQIFEQHLFVKSLDFQKILRQRAIHEVRFKEENLHQDLLAIAMASFELSLRCIFATKSDFEKFKKMLADDFQFKFVQRATHTKTNISDAATIMDVNESSHDVEEDDVPVSLPHTIFYNGSANSSWFGSLVLLRLEIANEAFNDSSEEDFISDWIFYNKDEQKTLLMVKHLFDAVKCTIKNMKYGHQNCDSNPTLIAFENALREELRSFSMLYQTDNDTQTFQNKFRSLAKYQFNTDLIANYFEC